MTLLLAENIKVVVKDRQLFSFKQVQIEQDDRIGIVGNNGSGKTTLLQVLAKKVQADEGTLKMNATLSFVPQLKEEYEGKSGGEITQSYLQKALNTTAELLLLDEPTTNLDTMHIEWLEKQLLNWKGAFVVVSHDRVFLDNLCTEIWEIADGSLTIYKGNYSNYVAQKELAKKQHETEYEKYVQKRKQLEEALKQKEAKAQKATKVPKKTSQSEAKITGAKPYFAKKQKKLQKTAKAMETRLEKLEKVEKPRELPPIQMDIPNADELKNKIIFRFEQVEGRIKSKVLWEKTSFYVYAGDKVAILGPNGSGKTTLLKKIMQQDEGIKISPAVKIGYFSQNLSILDIKQSILENVSNTSVHEETLIRTVLARLRFYRDDVYKKVEVLSGGERVKVALAKIFLSNINTLILDEPTNFLDIDAIEALEDLLQQFKGTILFVTHDRQFAKKIATKVLLFDNKTLQLFEGTYKELQATQQKESKEDELLLIETKLTEVLSRISIEPTEALEEEFQRLLQQKRQLQKQINKG